MITTISIKDEADLHDFCDKYGFIVTTKKTPGRKKLASVIKPDRRLRVNKELHNWENGRRTTVILKRHGLPDLVTKTLQPHTIAYGVNTADAIANLIENLNTLELCWREEGECD